jgi:acyl carrier protein phosphodiesterase
MNYLGHAFLSFGDEDILAGNMIGDHVKGLLALEAFPPKMKQGILLHRKIDSYTDTHPALQRAKVWFRQDYGLYSGAILDTLYDHFLATDARYFNTEKDLFNFTQDTYKQLEKNTAHFPLSFANYFPYMKEHNWLYGYRTLTGMQRALGALSRRAKHIPPIDKAYEIFISNYYMLGQSYYEFIDDVVTFVKIELSR